MNEVLKSTEAHRKRSLALMRIWMILCMFLNAVELPSIVRATDDVANVSPCELESIINQLVNPNPEYQLHASALRSQLRNILRDRQMAIGEEQSLNDYDYPEEDKRSVAALASLGYLRGAALSPKRSLATLVKNGQLPTQDPDEVDTTTYDKRYIGSVARGGGLMSYGKRNVGTLARDFQLPQNGKRNLATLARLGLINNPKRNLAAVARYNSNHMSPTSFSTTASAAAAEKRNLGALKGSPVHGGHQKRDDEQSGSVDLDYGLDLLPAGYWLYPSYADLDWDTVVHEQQKRFLDTSKDPELFGINNARLATAPSSSDVSENLPEAEEEDVAAPPESDSHQQQKRHIGSIARSGFLPSYRALRSTYSAGYGGSGGGGGGRFSRSGRARHLVEYYPQLERLRQPIAAVCKRCFLRPAVFWGGGAGMVGSRSGDYRGRLTRTAAYDENLLSNSLPAYERRPAAALTSTTSWGTPPRITALHRRSFRRPNAIESYQY